MTKKTSAVFIFFICCISIITTYSCSKEKGAIGTDEGTDAKLYEMAKETNGFTWFGNSSALLNKSSGSGHPQPFLRTRYNSVAATKLDVNGKIISGSVFPQGSLIVKELYLDSSTLGRYAILYKKSTSGNADANGWVWGYINPDGSVAEPASKKGVSCIGCHSQSGSIDYMLMNKFFP